MAMKSAPSVLIDATPIPADRGGVGRYVDGLVPALIETGANVTVVCQPRDVELFQASGARVESAPATVESTRGRFTWQQFGLPRLARRLEADVIHSVHYTFPLFTRRAHVVTIHDLTFFSHPMLHTRLKRQFFRAWIRACALFRVTVVTPSSATADEYLRVTHAKPATTVVALLGFDRALFSPPLPNQVEELRSTLVGGRGEWIAFLGTLEPRKNVTALIDGFVAATSSRDPRDQPSLLLAGGPGWDTSVEPAIRRAIAAGADVRALGYLSVQELPIFLGGAVIVAYPSLGEGFGLPVLEAMATGACVLTTRKLSLPEVGGDAVEYSGTSSDEIAKALSSLLDDPERREALKVAAVDRAQLFTWRATAARHVVAYTKALA
jgi:glycosyltransferase involved in cell wall biosynthesis